MAHSEPIAAVIPASVIPAAEKPAARRKVLKELSTAAQAVYSVPEIPDVGFVSASIIS